MKRITKESHRLTDDEENLPKDAYEIPSDAEGLDSNYEVYPSQENANISSGRHDREVPIYQGKGNIIKKQMESQSAIQEQKLRQKITDQATRLTQLETYKALCEQRIKQLCPSHNFPVSEADLKSHLISDTKQKNMVDSYINIIDKKDIEINGLKKRLENIETKYFQLQNANEQKTKNIEAFQFKNSRSPLNNYISNVDNLQLDKVKDNYNKLYAFAKELTQEKEVILESLRIETLNNEEQRNYIEMLRQTIESSIIKNGLGPFLQSIRHPQSKDSNVSNVDIVVDIALLKNESDKYRKELVMSQVLITELKQEIDMLKKNNEDMSLKKEKIKENLDKGLQELEHANNMVQNLEHEKGIAVSNVEQLKLENKRLIEELDNSNSTAKSHENEVNDQKRKINELHKQLDNQSMLQNKLGEYKKSFEKLYEDFEKLLKEKSNYEVENGQLHDDIKDKQLENNRLKNILEEKEERYDNEKKGWLSEHESLNRNYKKLERINNELNLALKDREKEKKQLEDKLLLSERNSSNLKSQLDVCINEQDDFKKATERKNDNQDKTIRDLNSLNKELSSSIEMVTIEKDNIYKDYINIKNECQKLDQDYQKIQADLNSKERNYSKLNDQYQNLFKDFKSVEEERDLLRTEKENLSRDIRYWKEKYDKDINTKIGEINILNREITSKNRNYDDLNKNQQILESELDSKHNMIIKLEDQLRVINSDLKNAQNNNEDLHKKLEKQNLEMQKEIKNNYELNTKLHMLNLQMEEMSKEINNGVGQIEKLELEKKRFMEELDSMRKADKNTQIKTHNLKSTLNETKLKIENLFSLIKNIGSRFKIMAEASPEIFSSTFIEILNSMQAPGSAKLVEVIKLIENWIGTVYKEFERLYDLTRSNNETILQQTRNKNDLEELLKRAELNDAERTINEKKISSQLRELEDENLALNNEREEIEKQYEKLMREYKSQRNENQNLNDEVLNLKKETNTLNNLKETITRENREKMHLLSNASYQVEALEERIVILVREKKYLESLLIRVSKSYPSREMHRIVNQILNVSDTLAQLERERIKIEDNLIGLNEKSRNDELNVEMSMRKEKENLNSLAYEYDAKIKENKELIENLENDIKNIEVNEKNASNILYEYEYKIKQLQKELVDAKEELRRNKIKSIGTTTSTSMKNDKYSGVDEAEFSYIEAQKLRNPHFKSNQGKYYQNYTNYDSIELNDHESYKKPENDRNELIDTFASQEYFSPQEKNLDYSLEKKLNYSSMSYKVNENAYRDRSKNRSYNMTRESNMSGL